MHCPACGTPLALALEAREAEPPEDELEAVVRRLEAEQYGNPEPLPVPQCACGRPRHHAGPCVP